jgi:hypothetical protein
MLDFEGQTIFHSFHCFVGMCNKYEISLNCSCVYLFLLTVLFPQCFAYFQVSVSLLSFIARICSLYLVWNDHPV